MTDDLAKTYQALTDDELMRLKQDSEELTPEAKVRLIAELAKRGSSVAELPERDRRMRFGPAVAPKDWRSYRRWTGNWPVLSIIAFVLHWIVILAVVMLLAMLASKRDWSETRLVLLIALLVFAESLLWERVRKAIRLKQLRSYRVARSARPR